MTSGDCASCWNGSPILTRKKKSCGIRVRTICATWFFELVLKCLRGCAATCVAAHRSHKMPRIAISAGHGLYVRGASGILDEVDEARRVVARLGEELA